MIGKKFRRGVREMDKIFAWTTTSHHDHPTNPVQAALPAGTRIGCPAGIARPFFFSTPHGWLNGLCPPVLEESQSSYVLFGHVRQLDERFLPLYPHRWKNHSQRQHPCSLMIFSFFTPPFLHRQEKTFLTEKNISMVRSKINESQKGGIKDAAAFSKR